MQTQRRQSLVSALVELLSYPDEAFVKCAFLMILRRVADAGGLRHYVGQLEAGTSRVVIALRLAHSHEAQSHGVNALQYDLALVGASLLRLPLVGRLATLLRPGSHVAQRVAPEFDPVVYLQESPDVLMDGYSAWRHYQLQGAGEGRCTSFDAGWYLEEYRDIIPPGCDPREHYERFGRAQRRYPRFDAAWYLRENPAAAVSGLTALEHYRRVGRISGRTPVYSIRDDYAAWVRRFGDPVRRVPLQDPAQPADGSAGTVISVLMAVPAGAGASCGDSLRSVASQAVPRCELCVVSAPDAAPAASAAVRGLSPAGVPVRLAAGADAARTAVLKAQACGLASGDWVLILEPGDVLAAGALSVLMGEIAAYPDAQLIYADEDCLSESGLRFAPYFKCDWNPDLFLTHDMLGPLTAIRRELVDRAGGYRQAAAGAEDYDLALRCIELIEPQQIRHVPQVLYHARAQDEDAGRGHGRMPRATDGGMGAVAAHLRRRGVAASTELTPHGYRVRYFLPESPPLASLLIPTRNGLELLERCIASIVSLTDYPNYEILVIDNGSDDPATLRYLERITQDPRVRVIRDPRPFNYSALNNAAAKLARGELLGLVNNDIEVISPGWLTEMVSQALRPEIAAVGARLWYPNNTLQHGGVILGRGGAWHAHTGIARGDPGYRGRAACVQSLSAVTAACLVVRKSVYESLGGLNEVDLTVAYNDVDFCLRALEAGYRNLWTPYADLYHHESASRGIDDTEEKARRARSELEYMQRRWGEALWDDPAYSPNLSGEYDDFSLAWPPRRRLR
jgi:GT2 family glycosyltransferase